MLVHAAERWELDLAIQSALDGHRSGSPVGTDVVCDMHGILEAGDRQLVRDVVALRLALSPGIRTTAA